MLQPVPTGLVNESFLLKTSRRELKIVFSDLVPQEIRSRKASLEFPMSLDVLETYLRQAGFGSCDFAFLPEEATFLEMARNGMLLETLGIRGQASYPVRDAGLWGINMMNYLQAPALFALLQLAGLPAHRSQRTAEFPLVVLGGHIWPNPLPLSDFFDVLVVGDGEEVLEKIAGLAGIFPENRAALLEAIASLDGVFVPGLTNRPVRKAEICYEEARFPAGSSYVLNGVGAVLLGRGCPHHCAFCINSKVGGNYRIKPAAQVLRKIDELKAAGARTLVPIATSASQYYSDGLTALDLVEYSTSLGLKVKMLSDRPEGARPEYLQLAALEREKLIIAPEASPRIRSGVFRKTIREETIQAAVSAVIQAGVNRIHLYLIVAVPPIRPGLVEFLSEGFAGENEQDLSYLANLGMKIADQMEAAGLKRAPGKPYVLLDCMPLIPAPGTALEKIPFPAFSVYQERINLLRSLIDREYLEKVEVAAAINEQTLLLQAFMDRGTARAGEQVWQIWSRSGSGLADPLSGTDLKNGLDLDDLWDDFLERDLPYAGMIEV